MTHTSKIPDIQSTPNAPPGETWNESTVYTDPTTLKRVRRLTCKGLYNQTPNYHTATGFTDDGGTLIFATAREGRSALCKADTASGEITRLTQWFDGMGCLDELHKMNGRCIGNGMGITMFACMAPHRREAVFVQGRSVRSVHLDTFQEKVLWENFGEAWICGMPSVDPLEKHVMIPLMPVHPEIQANPETPPERTYVDWHGGEGTVEVRLMEIPLEGGAPREVYAEKGVGCAHCPHNPVDGNLVLLDRDRPPKLWCGGDEGATSRVWVLSLKDGALTEIRPRNAQRFQVHAAWSWDGKAVLYHGTAADGGTYIGAASPDGRILNEYVFPEAVHYGHVSALAGRSAVLLDGNLTPDMLIALDYDRDPPRLELLARHGSDKNTLPWQYAHVHAQCDPTGRWISFHRGSEGRADVFLVER
ncbi:MAG: hypothetical protein JJU29_19645 [Verrucomicrobia bacterium]|nr:hypothetical protein [Verrucomicrobiota bacterium]MCH8512354.1 hypothetical protein [Kiritimatiellia bacterium]